MLQNEVTSFQPIADDKSKILILGTMPGNESLRAKEYYAHPDNLFWDILFRVCIKEWKCDELVEVDYSKKEELLLKNGIALWDVLQNCDRKGSLDIKIRNGVRNDFLTFFSKHPNIEHVFFNGKMAQTFFDDLIGDESIFIGRSFKLLPSTSPSNTMNSFFVLREWMQIRNYLIT